MGISVGDAIGPAFSRMADICFKPFNIGKWFVMGFCAFLSTCGEGGGGSGGNFNSGSRSSSAPSPFPSGDEISRFFHDYLGWLILAAILLFIVGIAITLVVTWLRCRGRFMFLDNIIENRAAVAEPWRRYARHANSYFLFSLVLMVISFLAILVLGGGGFMIAWPAIHAQEFTALTILALILCGLLLFLIMIALAIISHYAYDFVVPIMMLRDATFMPAWRETNANVARGNLGPLALFYLLKIAFAIAGGIVAIAAICATLCIGALPYLSSVLLLPILVFQRTFSLTFLEQFHPDYRLMKLLPPPPGFPVNPNPPPVPPAT